MCVSHALRLADLVHSIINNFIERKTDLIFLSRVNLNRLFIIKLSYYLVLYGL